MLEVLDSFEKFIRDNPNLTMFTYVDSAINIDDKEECRPKVDLPLGTETTFILQIGDGSGFWDDAIDEEYYYLYRYIKFKNATNDYVYIKIIAYNNLTGEVTIENPFGEAIVYDDPDLDMEIVVLDSLYINPLHIIPMGGSRCFTKEFERIDFVLKTKQDSKKRKMRSYIQSIKDWINLNYRSMSIYEETFTTIIGSATFVNDGDYAETLDSESQLVKYLCSVGLQYTVDYTG